MGSWKVAVTVYEDAPEHEHRVGRRSYLRHAAWYLSFPARTGNEVVTRLRAGGTRADIGEVDVKRVSELHAVVAAREVRHAQDLRSFGEVEPADGRERVA